MRNIAEFEPIKMSQSEEFQEFQEFHDRFCDYASLCRYNLHQYFAKFLHALELNLHQHLQFAICADPSISKDFRRAYTLAGGLWNTMKWNTPLKSANTPQSKQQQAREPNNPTKESWCKNCKEIHPHGLHTKDIYCNGCHTRHLFGQHTKLQEPRACYICKSPDHLANKCTSKDVKLKLNSLNVNDTDDYEKYIQSLVYLSSPQVILNTITAQNSNSPILVPIKIGSVSLQAVSLLI